MDIEQYRKENLEKTIFLRDEECATIMSGKSLKVMVESKIEYVEVKGRRLVKGDLFLVKKGMKPRWAGDTYWKWLDKCIGKTYIVDIVSFSDVYTKNKNRSFPRSSIVYVEKVVSSTAVVKKDEEKLKEVVEEKDTEDKKELTKNIKTIPNVKLKKGDWVLISGVPDSYVASKYNGQIKQISKIYYNPAAIFCKGTPGERFLRKEVKYIDPSTLPKDIENKKKPIDKKKKIVKKKILSVGTIVKIKSGGYKNSIGTIKYINNTFPSNKTYYLSEIGASFPEKIITPLAGIKNLKIGDKVSIIGGKYKGRTDTIYSFNRFEKKFYLLNTGLLLAASRLKKK